MKTILGLFFYMFIGASGALASEARVSDLVEKKSEDIQRFFEQDIDNANPFYGGFARVYLDKDLVEGNAMIREAFQIELNGAAESLDLASSALTPEIAASEYFKWQMRNWVLAYYLFFDRSQFFPGRLEPETQQMIEQLFWNYLLDEHNHTIRRTEPQYLFDIHGSENHELMRYSNLLLAAQALKHIDRFKGRELHDGKTVDDYFQAWNSYYRQYPLVRAQYGDMAEIFSMYAVYSLPELFNLFDFSEDQVLKSRMKKLLDLIWTDWSIAQINSIRGGVKTRIYQNPDQPDGKEMERGGKDARWRHISLIVFARPNWWQDHPLQRNSSHRIQGVSRVLASTSYRLPTIIKEIADDREGLGDFTFIALRPAKQRPLAIDDIPVWYDPYYSFDREDPRMLSYEFCTPDFVMGSLIIDPTLPLVPSHLFYTKEKKGNKQGYPALSTQSRYQSLIFPTKPTARVLPQCIALKNGVTYGQQQAVQHKNVMLVQRDVKAANTGGMRVFFSGGMKARLKSKQSWLFLEEGNAYLAVRAFSRDDGVSPCDFKWDNEYFLRLSDPQAPVVFILNRKAHAGSMEKFMESILATSTRLEDNAKFTFSGEDMDAEAVSLSLFLNCDRVPEVNGVPVDFHPEKIYDSPYLSSVHGSGIVKIQYWGKVLLLDFNEP